MKFNGIIITEKSATSKNLLITAGLWQEKPMYKTLPLLFSLARASITPELINPSNSASFEIL